MKSYVDFVSDIAINPELLAELREIVPFQTQQLCAEWFQAKGYKLSDAETNTFFQNQELMLEDTEQVQY